MGRVSKPSMQKVWHCSRVNVGVADFADTSGSGSGLPTHLANLRSEVRANHYIHISLGERQNYNDDIFCSRPKLVFVIAN
jgi:hypothetical protein